MSITSKRWDCCRDILEGGCLSHLADATPPESASDYWPCIYLSLPHTLISRVLWSWAKHHPTWNSAESSEGPVACWESQAWLAGATAHDGSRPYSARYTCGPKRKNQTIHFQTLPWEKETPHNNVSACCHWSSLTCVWITMRWWSREPLEHIE